MKKVFLCSIVALVMASCQKEAKTPAPVSANAEVKANWSSSAQYASWNAGSGYYIENNIWGSGAGPQTVWANTYSNWGVWADHPNTSGVKSYPNVDYPVNRTFSTLNTVSSSFNVTVPSSGSYESTYDIWCNNYAYEIMIWENWKGTVNPIAVGYNANGSAIASYTNVTPTSGGPTYTVYKGSNGSNVVYSFLDNSQKTSGTVNIKDILNFIQSKGVTFTTLDKVQFGFEITSSSGGLNFGSNSYSATVN
ncbi:MAG: glycoside hydrolase family 12 [Mucilaginibacter sp.]|nr:glycoside hydrolase family 12 [Mucilaginibacter sp.]